MNNTAEQRSQYDDEISLVDLATMFIRRRRVFYVVFIVITLGGLAYALLATETYQYTSLLQVAEKNSGKSLEAPDTTIATLENRWLPEEETLFRTENDRKLPLDVSFSNPENTGLIRFISETAQKNKEDAETVHANLIGKIQERQKVLMEWERKSLQTRIESVERAIETLQGGQDTGAAIAEAYERKVGLESDLESLKDPEVLVVSRESADKTGPARVLIMVLTLLMAGILGVISAFLMEFASSVRTALQSED